MFRLLCLDNAHLGANLVEHLQTGVSDCEERRSVFVFPCPALPGAVLGNLEVLLTARQAGGAAFLAVT